MYAVLDTIIVGAGPAGLTAASYLGRFHRKPLVIDGGASRARWIPESHNIPGFPRGISGSEFLSQLQTQAVRYGADIRPGQVERIERIGSGFQVQIGDETVVTGYLLLATGVRDQLPDLPPPIDTTDIHNRLRVRHDRQK
jgi:thioredoxin reductase (NADPH)